MTLNRLFSSCPFVLAYSSWSWSSLGNRLYQKEWSRACHSWRKVVPWSIDGPFISVTGQPSSIVCGLRRDVVDGLRSWFRVGRSHLKVINRHKPTVTLLGRGAGSVVSILHRDTWAMAPVWTNDGMMFFVKLSWCGIRSCLRVVVSGSSRSHVFYVPGSANPMAADGIISLVREMHRQLPPPPHAGF